MIKLIPMTQPEFEKFLDHSIPDYAAENVKAGYWSQEESLEKSREQFNQLLPQGLQSENHHLFSVYEEDASIGFIWLRANINRPTKDGFIFQLWLDEKVRGKGYGKQAMLLLEEKARELGLRSIGLHVFASNSVARGLYEKLGYEVSSLNMTKSI
jgi:ribosomal protein S18 acetylase RimI-like enzyme